MTLNPRYTDCDNMEAVYEKPVWWLMYSRQYRHVRWHKVTIDRSQTTLKPPWSVSTSYNTASHNGRHCKMLFTIFPAASEGYSWPSLRIYITIVRENRRGDRHGCAQCRIFFFLERHNLHKYIAIVALKRPTTSPTWYDQVNALYTVI